MGKEEGIVFSKPQFCWVVNLHSLNGKIVGEYIKSPKFFSIHGDSSDLFHQWRILLYPEGQDEDSAGYLSLFLFHWSESKIRIRYSFSILNEDNTKVNLKSHNQIFETKDNWGFTRFVQKSFLTDPKNKIDNNQLNICCNIYVQENSSENKIKTPVSTNSSRLRLVEQYKKLYTNKDISDIIVTAGSKKFYLHKCILMNCSDVFEAMFRNNMKEKKMNSVEITDIDSKVLQELFYFIYTGEVKEINKMAFELLPAAEKYCIENLKDLCEETLSNQLSDSNVFRYLNLAIINNAKNLQTVAMNYISLYLDDFIDKKELNQFAVQFPELFFKITNNHLSKRM